LKSSVTHVIHTPRPDTTPEAGLNALAAVYRFVLDCHAKKNPAAGPGERGENDGKAKGDFRR
jgi:hypothetical protein